MVSVVPEIRRVAKSICYPPHQQILSLSPDHRFVIALHSPDRVAETGLCVWPPEKSARKTYPRASTGHFLRCGVKTRPAELRRFSLILAVTQTNFSTAQTVWRRGEGFAAVHSIKRTYADFKELAVSTDLFCQQHWQNSRSTLA